MSNLKAVLFFVLIILPEFINSWFGDLEDTSAQERPYQVLILRDNVYRCSGTLISHKCVITAGSCILSLDDDLNNLDNLNAKFDLLTFPTFLEDGIDAYGEQASSIYMAPGYKRSINDYDVAILCSSKNLTGTLATIFKGELELSSMLEVSGWGMAYKNDKMEKKVFRKALLELISLKECRKRFIGVRTIPDNVLCAMAFDNVRGFCAGDVGGPLTFDYSFAGIALTDFNCKNSNYPVIFANVSMLAHFIKKTVTRHDLKLKENAKTKKNEVQKSIVIKKLYKD